MTEEQKVKARMTRDRLLATLALIGAMACMHYAYAASGWQVWAYGAATGFLASFTINRTVKASVWASALVTAEAIKQAIKAIERENAR